MSFSDEPQANKPQAGDQSSPSDSVSSPAETSPQLVPTWSESDSTRGAPVTWGLLGLIGVVYLLSTYPDFQRLNPVVGILGAMIPQFVMAGEWWRLLTANLLHADIHHLLNNLFGLLIFGQLLESAIGSRRLLGLIVSSSLSAMGLSLFLLKGSTVGASGIGYGFIGCYMTLLLIVRRAQAPKLFWGEFRSALVFVAIFIVWNTMELQHINLWGHVGGYLAGCLYAIWITRKRYTVP